MSNNDAILEASRNGVLWVVQVFGAILLLIAGSSKLAGDGPMIQTFDAIGMGQQLSYVTGIVEIASAILLLIPAIAGITALLLVPTTIGAILTHLLVIDGSIVLPLGTLIIVSVVAWGRNEMTLRLIRHDRV